jgi:hypothetical protein
MHLSVSPEILIHRPKAEVAAYMFDPAHEAEWTSGVVESRPMQADRLKPGDAVERTTAFMGRRFAYRYEVVGGAGDDFIELTVEHPFPMRIRYELEDARGGTMARILAAGDPGGFFGLLTPLMKPMVAGNIAKDLRLLKRRLERG